jgi:stearoyl-CoA desaturase (delta-9 desaturase)
MEVLAPAPAAGESAPAPPRRQEPGIRQELPRSERFALGLAWPTVFWIGLLHLGALAAPFTFTGQGLALFAILVWLTGGVGICLGYHRLFSHHSFVAPRPLRWLLAWLGGLAGEGPVIRWVAIHRLHHARSDQEGDPHSPRDGFWWSHMLWIFPRDTAEENRALYRRWAPDLLRDPVLRFIDATFILWHLLLGTALFLLGYLLWDLRTGLSLLVWGMFLRLVFVLHGTWLINSATHLWGYRSYETTDTSRNLWWVALLTFGEGWHNNHHAHPRMAKHGHRWWELDPTWLTIRLLRGIGLASKVADRPARRRAAGAAEG